MNTKVLLLSTIAALATPFAASAITLTAGSDGTLIADLVPDNNVIYNFDVDQELDIFVTFAATGFEEDLDAASYGFFEDQYSFDDPEYAGPLFAGTGTMAFTTDESFTLGFFNGIENRVGTTLTYFASAPEAAPIPVPAAGLLLLGALGTMGGATVMRRKAA